MWTDQLIWKKDEESTFTHTLKENVFVHSCQPWIYIPLDRLSILIYIICLLGWYHLSISKYQILTDLAGSAMVYSSGFGIVLPPGWTGTTGTRSILWSLSMRCEPKKNVYYLVAHPTNHKWVTTLVISMGFLWGQCPLKKLGWTNPPKGFVGWTTK